MRLPEGGLIDRSERVAFTFDGETFESFAGDTIASALLASGVRLFGRSFKYHRPRGVWGAGSEEPNALLTTGVGAGRIPNVRATVQEVWNGLSAESQNRWPSLRRDVLAFNDLAARFLGAGFYYKTFMWPRRAWERLYEPAIRRAAGLGSLPVDAAPARAEKAFAYCDLLVVGGGPAGLAAALAAARSGADVIIADEGSRLGGRLLAERETIGGAPAVDWVSNVARELERLENVRVLTRTTVTGAFDQGTYSAHERVAHHYAADVESPADCFWRIVALRAVLATGAVERVIAFPGNDRPGVMSAAAVRAYLNRWAVAPGRKVAVFGCNDDVARTADDLRAEGVEVVAVIRSDHGAETPGGLQGVVAGTRGRRALREIIVREKGCDRRIEADCLAVAGGWNPMLHLSSHTGARPVWNDELSAFVPGGEQRTLFPAGSVRGISDTAGCLADGLRAARETLGAAAIDLPEADGRSWRISPLWSVSGRGRAFLDLQNDVTVKDVLASAAEGMVAAEHMKRWTTQGMATDQGRSSNVTAMAVLAEATGRSVAETGTTTFRPPVSPTPIAAIGAGGRGDGFAPLRRTPSHDWAERWGAPMVEAGLWRRPAYFPKPDESHWRQSCDREVAMVRNSVGVTDASTLGKIEVAGPDAARFLDFVYANSIGTLREGRVRYGIMLREDGHLLDDGTCARIGPERWLVTTTTAAAQTVLRHMEFAHQCLRPELDLRMASVTDQWAQFALAGPKARELMAEVVDRLALLGFMSFAAVSVAGVPARLFRISFSGELGFELAVPARFGAALWRVLVEAAEAMGGGPYGIEALEVLRLEKGFLTHREMDGRTTAFDLGLGGMVRDGRIGSAAARRPGLIGPERGQLVGLTSDERLTAGALLFSTASGRQREDVEGHVTSACWSPTLGRWLALALLRNGRERHGEWISLVDRMREVEAACIVGQPCAYDPTGVRMRRETT